MATIARSASPVKSIAPDRYERVLAIGAIVLLVAVIAALARGRAEWGQVPATIWLHIASIGVALTLTPTMLLRRRGDRLHRQLGTIWMVAMLGTALLTFRIQTHPGHYSWIHLLSIFVTVMVPYSWWSAHNHRIDVHRRTIRGMVTGALLIAGFFTFPFNRLLGHWLFG